MFRNYEYAHKLVRFIGGLENNLPDKFYEEHWKDLYGTCDSDVSIEYVRFGLHKKYGPYLRMPDCVPSFKNGVLHLTFVDRTGPRPLRAVIDIDSHSSKSLSVHGISGYTSFNCHYKGKKVKVKFLVHKDE